jgi:hypothetical protein
MPRAELPVAPLGDDLVRAMSLGDEAIAYAAETEFSLHYLS